MNCSVTCQSVQSQMADFSAGQLSPVQARTFEEHCSSCAHCRNEWDSFQSTLQLLCALPQALPCEELSDEMWNCCCQDWMSHVEEPRHKVGPFNALRHCMHWINQQPRWAQGGWAVSGVVATGIALFLGSTWVVSPSERNVSVVASNIATNATPAPVTIDGPLLADGGPLRFMGRSQTNAPVVPYALTTANTHEVLNSTPSSRPVDFNALPFAALAGQYRDNRQVLPFDRFMNRVGHHQGFESPSQVPQAARSTASPFALEVHAEEEQQPVFAPPPLLHGE